MKPLPARLRGMPGPISCTYFSPASWGDSTGSGLVESMRSRLDLVTVMLMAEMRGACQRLVRVIAERGGRCNAETRRSRRGTEKKEGLNRKGAKGAKGRMWWGFERRRGAGRL